MWDRFKDIITYCVHKTIKESDAPELAETLTWTFFDDQAAFGGAMKADLRRHFNPWVQEKWKTEQPRGRYITTPRYRHFVDIDRGVLDSIPEILDEEALIDTSHENFVDGEWRAQSERASEEESEKFEPIEGVTDEDVGLAQDTSIFAWCRPSRRLLPP